MGVDPGEGPERLQSYSDQMGYPWEVFVGNRDIIFAYNVTVQSTKLVIDRDGVIAARDGYGVKSANAWRDVLDTVSAG